MLTIGIKGEARCVVSKENTAATHASGALAVFATPAMIALMEQCANDCVFPYLEAGQGTVGTRLDVRHLSPTPVGMKVRAECELIEIDRRRLVFCVAAYDEKEKIGEGIHERFIINNEKFMKKVQEKLNEKDSDDKNKDDKNKKE